MAKRGVSYVRMYEKDIKNNVIHKTRDSCLIVSAIECCMKQA